MKNLKKSEKSDLDLIASVLEMGTLLEPHECRAFAEQILALWARVKSPKQFRERIKEFQQGAYYPQELCRLIASKPANYGLTNTAPSPERFARWVPEGTDCSYRRTSGNTRARVLTSPRQLSPIERFRYPDAKLSA